MTWMRFSKKGCAKLYARCANTLNPVSTGFLISLYKGKKTAIDKIYPRHFLATAKVLKFPEVQMHEILSDFARMIPAALDNVKTSLPTDFPENVVTAVETNVLRLHGRLSREYGIK
ncbi:serine/threonine-protein kinase HipA [Escherichia coli]|nr:serine/threonine-protein kinase HipA [Escherichia coli]OYA95183.1 serine/threonine-protein kinase HipA [Escherichia coli]